MDNHSVTNQSVHYTSGQLTTSHRVAIVITLMTILGLLNNGCDMPETEPTMPQAPLKITYGPYLADQRPDQVTVCFRTNRPCVAGLRIPARARNRMERFDSGDNNHRVVVRGLSADANTSCEIFLNDQKTFILHLRGGVTAGAPTTLAFLRSEERRVGKECRSRGSPYH